MDKKNKNDRRWILNLFLGKLHWSPKWSDQANNHGKVAAVKTDAVDSESDPKAAMIESKIARSWSEEFESENELANLSQPIPNAVLKMKSEIWIELPREKPSMRKGKGIHAAPSGRTNHEEKLADKLVLSGYEIKLGAIEAPSTHCWLVNTCWAMSSPTEQGTLISDNLKKINKIKNILSGDRFSNFSLHWILTSICDKIGEIKRKIIIPKNEKNNNAHNLDVE